ncbi:GNAT family N-acetyltransferase [Periweissella beninensis]|uniref:GNAT family N-acetyltransferase n=1 Tax=Periweissella beninensis TaxID=504936 RepID=UPI0021A296D0|nr:GNAT family N-acetyltransferase [Periweissella beninensis]MCT4395983.1 N-acetyltransferase [Periweissella beninensis]
MWTIKKLAMTDAEGYKNLLKDHELANAAGFVAIDNAIMLDMLFVSTLKNDITYLILLNQQTIGSISFSLSLDFTGYEVGYMLKQQYRHQGIMRQAFPRALEAFKELRPMATLFAKVHEKNSYSKRILSNSSFMLYKQQIINQQVIEIYQKELQ